MKQIKAIILSIIFFGSTVTVANTTLSFNMKAFQGQDKIATILVLDLISGIKTLGEAWPKGDPSAFLMRSKIDPEMLQICFDKKESHCSNFFTLNELVELIKANLILNSELIEYIKLTGDTSVKNIDLYINNNENTRCSKGLSSACLEVDLSTKDLLKISDLFNQNEFLDSDFNNHPLRDFFQAAGISFALVGSLVFLFKVAVLGSVALTWPVVGIALGFSVPAFMFVQLGLFLHKRAEVSAKTDQNQKALDNILRQANKTLHLKIETEVPVVLELP